MNEVNDHCELHYKYKPDCRDCLAARNFAVLHYTETPVPAPSGIEAEVCADIAARQVKGLAKYGVSVADNPLTLKEWLEHAYTETLDKAIYLKRAIREMEQ